MTDNNPGWRETADYTGKAPEHVIAATKRKTDGVSRAPMYKQLITQKLLHSIQAYNPFFIVVGGRTYELKDIIFYKKNGETIKNGKGWFGSNNSLTDFEIPVATKRLKIKLDGSTFIFPKKKDWYERHDTTPHAILYIPYEYFDFEYREVNRKWESGMTINTPTHISRRFTMDMSGTPLMVQEHAKSTTSTSVEAERVKTDIRKLEQELADKKKELQRL